jgi:DnaK suppressor protein
MAKQKRKEENAPEERLEADRRLLELLAAQCGEEAGLHRPLNDVVGGVITGIPEDTDLAQALSDRETTDLLVHLLDQNREQVERALERLHEGAYGICEGCGRAIPEARLKYQPAATRCVECQAHWDRLNGRTA